MELAAPHDELREQLTRIDDYIESGIEALVEYGKELDPTQVGAFVATAERFALRLDGDLPPQMNAAAVAEIRGILIGALRKLREAEKSDAPRPLDMLDDFLIRAESIRHIIRDLLDEELPVNASDPQALVKHFTNTLPRLTKKQLATMLGVEPKTLQRWENGSGRVTHRAQLVLRMVVLLSEAWTSEGVHAWFQRPRHDLEGRRPVDLLDDASNEQALMKAVRTGRAQHGS